MDIPTQTTDSVRSLVPDDLIDQKEAARLLGIRPRTLQEWRYEGRGPGWFKVGQSVRYSRKGLEVWLAARAREAVPR
jgi:hypothetical protein